MGTMISLIMSLSLTGDASRLVRGLDNRLCDFTGVISIR